MPLILANRVQETSTTTGTGTLTLDGAVLGYQTFAAGIGSGNTCYYAITSSTGEWEVGIGTVGTGTLARTTLLSSSTGSLVSFTGTLNVYVTYPSEKSVNLDAANVITGYPITVTDNVFTLQDNVDPTKQAQFQLSGVPTATTVVYNLPYGTVTPVLLAATNVPLTFTSGQSFSAQNNNFGTNATASTTNVGSGATTTGLTKTVNLGTGGLSGSTTNITVGSANGSTTTMLGSTVIGGVAGSQSLQVNNVASAVNYAQVIGATTGGYPAIQGQGTDTNVGLLFDAKGNASQFFRAQGGAVQFVVGATASAANYLVASGATTTNYPILAATGSDANVGFVFNAKGTGFVALQTNSLLQAAVTYTASAVNYLNLTGAATGGAPTLSAQGSDANINLKLTPKGTGDVQITGTAYSPNFNLTDAATIAWDTATAGGQVATFTFVSSNRTMGAPTNLVNGAFYALAVIQNAGSNTLTWNSVFKWAAGTAPTLSTAAGAKDYFTFRSDGTNLYQQGISQAVA